MVLSFFPSDLFSLGTIFSRPIYVAGKGSVLSYGQVGYPGSFLSLIPPHEPASKVKVKVTLADTLRASRHTRPLRAFMRLSVHASCKC